MTSVKLINHSSSTADWNYYIKPEKSNYFFLDNSYFKRNYPAKIAGFLLLLKSVCLNNTDTIQ